MLLKLSGPSPKFIKPTRVVSIAVVSLGKILSVIPSTNDSIYTEAPIKSGAFASPLRQLPPPRYSLNSFHWQTTPWRPWRFLNAVRKGHDIQKWHPLWGNGLDVWPLNKVSSIGSISKQLGIFCISKEWSFLCQYWRLSAQLGVVSLCVMANKAEQPPHTETHSI